MGYNRIVPIFLISLLAWLGASQLSCASSSVTQSKASPSLLAQIDLRRQQSASPTPERLARMRAAGMSVENLSIQRVYIHLASRLTPAQADELRALGVTVYPDSWVPPVGQQPTGFVLADMPVDKLDVLAARDYVVRLETAEREVRPLPGLRQDR